MPPEEPIELVCSCGRGEGRHHPDCAAWDSHVDNYSELERVDMILDPPAPEYQEVCPTCGGKEIDGRCDNCQRSGTN